MAKDGNDVFINYAHNDDAAAEAAAMVEERGGHPHVIKADVGTRLGGRDVVAEVSKRTERLDQIVHCAAAAIPGPLLEVDPDDIAYAVQVNALSLIDVVRE